MCFIVGCICSIKGVVVVCSAGLAGSYFIAAYYLREVVFPPLKIMHEFWPSYMASCSSFRGSIAFADSTLVISTLFEQAIKYGHIPVMDWIHDIQFMFRGALCYVAIGLAGLLGALLEVELFLWAYAVYLCGSATVTKLWSVLKGILEKQDDLRKSCNAAGKLMGFNCDAKFDEAKLATKIGAGVVGLLLLTTLLCTLWMIRTIHRETGAWLFTFCGEPCGRSRSSKADELGSGWARQKARRGRVRRGDQLVDEEEGIQLLSLGVQSAERRQDRTFELPRATR
ncbi:uncharacterized protein JCM15063_000105 [Sporobolomyces koalae]|uniref:uncharacterized protein n=1 Tax=Sporobolomyces koalae TaxID=500713 RepID=UPI0031815D91